MGEYDNLISLFENENVRKIQTVKVDRLSVEAEIIF